MPVLLIKVSLMPVVIGLVTLATRRWGHTIGGLIGSMPWMAGPILLFFILEQGKAFGIQSIPGVLTGILSLIGFCLTYAALSRRLPPAPTLLLAYLVYVGVALVFNQLAMPLVPSYGLVIGCVLLALRFFPKARDTARPARRLPYDSPRRMGVATGFVLAITGLAQVLGPAWSGILTPFPILTTILSVFAHYLQGSAAAIATLRGLMIGLLGFTTFLFLQAFLLPHFPVAVAFGLALVVNGSINAVAGRIWR